MQPVPCTAKSTVDTHLPIALSQEIGAVVHPKSWRECKIVESTIEQ